jgi:hypothetical protein
MGALGGFMSGLGGSGLSSAVQKFRDKHKKKQSGSISIDSSGQDSGELPSYHKGGKVKDTGPAMLKKGERVLTKKQNKRYSKMRGKY